MVWLINTIICLKGEEFITQEEKWKAKYEEVMEFIKTNKRNPSKHRIEEHDMLNWVKQQRKLMNAGKMKLERVEKLTIVDFRHDSTKFEWTRHCAHYSESLEIFWRWWNSIGGRISMSSSRDNIATYRTRRNNRGIPRFGFSWAELGDVAFGRGCSLAAVVADDLVDLDDDVLGDAGLYGSAIDHLCEVDALLVRPNNQTRHGQLPHQDTANCHIKNQSTATSRIGQLSHQESANCHICC